MWSRKCNSYFFWGGGFHLGSYKTWHFYLLFSFHEDVLKFARTQSSLSFLFWKEVPISWLDQKKSTWSAFWQAEKNSSTLLIYSSVFHFLVMWDQQVRCIFRIKDKKRSKSCRVGWIGEVSRPLTVDRTMVSEALALSKVSSNVVKGVFFFSCLLRADQANFFAIAKIWSVSNHF